MAYWYARNNGQDFQTNSGGYSTQWNSAFDGSGSWSAYPLSTTDTYDANSYIVALGEDVTAGCLTNAYRGGGFSVAANATCNLYVSSTAGIVGYIASAAYVVAVSNSNVTLNVFGQVGSPTSTSGYCIQCALASSAVNVNNGSGTAVLIGNSGSNITPVNAGPGTTTITGGTGYANAAVLTTTQLPRSR